MKKTISLILTTAIICSIISFTSLVPNVSAATTNTIYSEGFNNLTVDSDITSQLSPSWWKYFSLKSKSAITNPNPSEVALIKNVSVGNNKLTIGQTSTVISPLEYTGDGFRMNTDFTATDVYTPAQSVDVRDYKLVYELDTAVAANANGGFREFKFYLTIPSVEDTTANSQTGPDANNYYYYNISQKFIDSKWYKPSNTLAGFTIAQYKFNSVFDWKFYANNNSTSAYCADGTSYQSGKANETSLANTLNRVKLEVIVKEGGVSKNVYRLFFNGIQMGGDYSMTNAISATNKFVGGIGFAPSTTSNVLTSVDNINVYTVSKSYGEATAILNNTFENTTDIANDGYTLATNSSSGILTYNSSFGRNKYANVTSTTAIPSVSKNITVNLPTNTLEDYKTVFIADVLAKPGSKFEVKQADGSSAFSILFNQSDNEIILNSSSGSRPLKLYNSNQWYRFRIDLSAIKNNAEAKTMDVYIDNSLMFSDIACQYTTLGSINFSGIQNSSVSFDNVNVTGVYGSYDILDNTKMMYEIQMADNLIKYYETEQLSNKPLSQYYFIDSVQTANIKYMGATNYNNYKNALAQAKELYYSATSMTQINAKIDEMWSYVSEIGGEIRELYFNDGILNGFTGKAVLVKDELPIMSYGLKVSGDGDFIFPKTGISNVDGFNVSTLGNGCEVQIDFDTKISDTTGVVTYAFGDKDGNSAIQLRLNGTTKAVELLSGATWNTIQSGIEANKWYNIKVTLRITNGGNTYNGFYKVLIDGVEKQAYTAYLNTVKYINRASVIGATDNNTVLIDNFKVAKLIAKDAPTYTLNEKGALISEIRQGQIKLNQYTSGNEPGQCSTDTYNNLKTITNLAVDRYNQKTMRITNSTAIPTNITNVTSAINALVINPYNDFYLDSIRYKDSQNNTVFSPVSGGVVSGVDIRRYAQTVDANSKLIVAVYNDNKLENTDIYDLSSVTLGSSTVDVNVAISSDGCIVKAFIWDMGTLKALAKDSIVSDILKENNIKLYIAGDSTVANYQLTSYPQSGWGQQMGNYFDANRVVVDNRAIGGYSTKKFIDDGKLSAIGTAISAGDYLIIQFGHNDQKDYDPTVYADIPTYKANLVKFIDVATSKGANAIICTPIMRRLFTGDQISDVMNLNLYADAARQVASEKNVPLIDLYALQTAKLNELGVDGSKNLYNFVEVNDPRYISDPNFATSSYKNITTANIDNTHFNIYGADVAAGFIASQLLNLKHPLSAVLINHTPTMFQPAY